MILLGILSLPRSGTNHLTRNLLAPSAGVLNLDEAFHNLPEGVDAERIGQHFASFEEYRAAATADPVGTLRLLASGSGAEIAIFKVFPDHMETRTFELLAGGVDGFVVLTRNPLSTWVSNRIALELGTWFGVRTDDRTIPWNAADFVDHSIERLGFLNDRSRILRECGVPTVELTYGEIGAPTVSTSTIWERIAKAIPPIERAGVLAGPTAGDGTVTVSAPEEGPATFKQDSRPPLVRIENWPLALADLEAWGLQWLRDEDVAYDRVAIVNLLKAVRRVRAGETAILAFERERALKEIEQQQTIAEAVRQAQAEVERTRSAKDQEIERLRAAMNLEIEQLRTAMAQETERSRTAREQELTEIRAAADQELELTRTARDREKDQALADRARVERAAAALASEGDRMAKELRRAYARPLRPLKRALQRAGLRFVLLFRGVLSERTVQKVRRSVAKRKPNRYVKEWQAAQVRAWGEVSAPILPSVQPKRRRKKGSALAYHSLNALATISAPFSARRAERFRRSAEKRSPYRRLDESAAAEPALALLAGLVQGEPVADAAQARRILVADYRLPRPDVSAGERATVGLVADLRALGFEVVFVPTDMEDTAPYRQDLEALGVEVISRSERYTYGNDYIRAEGMKFGAFYFIRVDVAEALLPSARAAAPNARIIFHAPDLYFLREGRAAELSGNPADAARAAKTRLRETAIMRAADHVVLVSPAEIPLLTDIVPRNKISVFPALYCTVQSDPAGYDARKDIFFIGGFKHLPNVDSVKWFVDKVWPAVHAALPEVEFHIVGAEAPEDVVELGSRPGVHFVGYVEDLDPVLARYRISVAPLLYGAGIKGKLGAAMGGGVPSVSTTIGAEGMDIVDGVHALVRDEPGAFAQGIIDLYGDAALWSRIAANGRRLVEDKFGNAANRTAFFRVLDEAGALPLELYIDHCRAAAPGALPAPDASEPVDVSIIVPVHNQWALTQTCLNSVSVALRGNGLVCEIILADDASKDETERAAMLFPGLKVVRQESNLGFLGNCNAAASTARGSLLLFLNNDTVVMPNWLTELCLVFREEPNAAIVGSKLLYPDGAIQEAGGVLYSDATAANLGRGQPRHDPFYSFDREVDYETGASIAVRRSFWEAAGGFDKRFSPAYCEDSDLAMTARAGKMQVILAARSHVLHFEHGTYGEEIASAPKSRATINGKLLLQKWLLEFSKDHLPPSTQPEIAAAHAERTPFAKAAARRQSGKLNILYFSPFPSHPDSHGNQATIQAFARRFQKMGHKVHFALLQSGMFDAAAAEAMRNVWDSFDVLPNTHPLGADGERIPFDGWYEPGLGENIHLLCHKYDIDVVFCSYVFQSKLLEFVPAHALKVIDTHDKMGGRYEMLKKNGLKLEFFSCSPEEEGAYLRRADVVVARREEEAKYFNSVSGRESAIVIPHVEEPRFQERVFDQLRNVGVVASANRINLIITLDFLKAIQQSAEGGRVPFQVHVAGQVKSMIPELSAEDRAVFSQRWVKLHGFVPDIADFYAKLDAVVSPVTMGTGINVKTVQAMAYGMPLLTTVWGGKGIETGHPQHQHADLRSIADSLIRLAKRPDELSGLASVSRKRYQSFYDQSLQSMSGMFEMVRC